MHELKVGKLYIEGKTHWPDGIAEYNYYQGGHELRLFFANPSQSEIMDIRRGNTKFGLMIRPNVLFLIYKIGNLDGDAPYSIHRLPEMPPVNLPIRQERVILQIHLVDSATGILKAMRAVTFSIDFSKRIHEVIFKQSQLEFSDINYNREIDATYQKYQTTDQMFHAADITCIGGK